MADWCKADIRHQNLAQSIIDAEPKELGHIDLDLILFLELVEEKPKEPMKIKKIPDPYSTLLGKDFYIAVSEELLSQIPDEHYELDMFRMLLHIDPEPGKMRFPDVQEFSCIIDNFGYGWREKQSIGSIINMLKSGKKIIK